MKILLLSALILSSQIFAQDAVDDVIKQVKAVEYSDGNKILLEFTDKNFSTFSLRDVVKLADAFPYKDDGNALLLRFADRNLSGLSVSDVVLLCFAVDIDHLPYIPNSEYDFARLMMSSSIDDVVQSVMASPIRRNRNIHHLIMLKFLVENLANLTAKDAVELAKTTINSDVRNTILFTVGNHLLSESRLSVKDAARLASHVMYNGTGIVSKILNLPKKAKRAKKRKAVCRQPILAVLVY